MFWVAMTGLEKVWSLDERKRWTSHGLRADAGCTVFYAPPNPDHSRSVRAGKSTRALHYIKAEDIIVGYRHFNSDYHDFHIDKATVPELMTSVLNLIAATILADDRAEGSGGSVFVTEIERLLSASSFNHTMSQAQCLLWYELNKDSIRQILASDHFERWYYDHLSRLSHMAEKQPVLDTMRRITSAGKTSHVNGTALLDLTRLYWRVR